MSADYRPTMDPYNEPLLTICCEDDNVGCVLMERFLELRGESDTNFIEDPESFIKHG